MRVLYFTNIPSPYRVEFFTELNKHVELTVLFDRQKDKERNEKWFEENNYDFDYEFIGNFNPKKVISHIKKNYDVVVIGGYTQKNCMFAIEYMRINKIPFYINADGGFVNPSDNIITKNLKKHFISSADYYLSTGVGTNNYLIHYGAKKENIYIYSFTSLREKELLKKVINYKEKRKKRKEFGLDYDRLFISVGQFIHRKGYDLLIETVNKYKIKNCGFVIIGGGEEKENYKSLLKKYNINNIHFIDFLKKDELLEYFKLSDVFIFPTREDIWGLVINEALACGLPIISTKQCLASLELLDEKYLYDVNDLERMRKLIREFVDCDNKELEKLSKEALKLSYKYTIENMAKEHKQIFERNLTNDKK